MSHTHAVVWLDHNEARVMHLAPDDVETLSAHASGRHRHLHHKRGGEGHESTGDGRAPQDTRYLEEVVRLLDGAQEILVTGPGQAKLALVKHVHRHHQSLVDRILGVETVDHPSDGQLIAYARRYFRARDGMLDQGGHVS